jgi:hypothetical protein
MTVVSFPARAGAVSRGTWSLLEIALPGRSPEPLGILLVSGEMGKLTLRVREAGDFDDLEEQDADFLAALAVDLAMKAAEPGGALALLASLEDSLSGFLRIGDRNAIEYAGDAGRVADRLFRDYVSSATEQGEVLPAERGEVIPFVTHLPLYGLRAAATKFGDGFDPDEVNEPDAWVRAPHGMRLSEGMFVAQVVGRSMEPLIPDGSYCVFRAPVIGTRQGKRLLIEQTRGAGADPSSRYTVKRYTSRKTANEDGSWEHASIRLEPLNREFEAFDLGEGEFRVIAEFVQVLSS